MLICLPLPPRRLRLGLGCLAAPVAEPLEPRTYFAAAVAGLSFSGPTPFPAGASPGAVRVADFNGDAKADLVLADQSGGNASATGLTLLLGNGNGTFQQPAPVPLPFLPFLESVADVNGDGKADLLVADSGSSSPTIMTLLGNGDGTFQPFIDSGLVLGRLVLGDWNGDGKVDMATVVRGESLLHLALGNGDGTFAIQPSIPLPDAGLAVVPISVQGEIPRQVGVLTADAQVNVDFRNSVANPTTTSVPSSFETDVLPIPIMGIPFFGGRMPSNENVDLPSTNGDAWISVAGGAYQDAGLTGRTIVKGHPTFVTGVAGDFDADGLLDAAYVDLSNNVVRVLPRASQSKFAAPLVLSSGGTPSAIDAGDFNGDGKDDIVVADSTAGTANIFLSTSGGGGGGGGGGSGSANIVPTITPKVPATVIIGQKAKASVAVTLANNGTGAGSVSQVQLFASTDQVLDGGDVSLANYAKAVNLKPRHHKKVSFNLARALVSAVGPGTYSLLLQVTDSTGAAGVEVLSEGVTVVAPVVRLSGAYAAATPAVLVPGKKASVAVMVTNSGNITASGPLTLSFSAAAGAIPLATITKRIKIRMQFAKVLKLRFKVPAGLAAGSYFLQTQLDASFFGDADPAGKTIVSATPFTVA